MRAVFFALLFFSACATVDPRLDPMTARCDSLAAQYRAYGALAIGASALGASGIAPSALLEEKDARIAFGITASVLVATGLALHFVAGDVETSWVEGCQTETSTIGE